MNGGEALVKTLIAQGYDLAFGVPGESYLAVLEAMRAASFRFIVTRHESGAAFAADAVGKLTRRPGLAFVTRGPGATNAAIGVHTAAQGSTPLVLFIGQAPSHRLGREAFQEIDYGAMFATIAKQVIEPREPGEVAATTGRALEAALSERPGPVVLVLPEDVTMGDAGTPEIPASKELTPLAPPPDAIGRAGKRIEAARRPIVIAGGMISHEGAHGALIDFAEASGAVVTTAWRRQDAFPCDHPAYGGHLGIGRGRHHRALFAECDLVIAAGTRLDDITTEEGTLIRPGLELIQIYPEAAVLARSHASIPIRAAAGAALKALTAALEREAPPERIAWRDQAHREQSAFARPGEDPKLAPLGRVAMARVVEAVAERVGRDHVIVNDAGNFAGWVQRYFPFREPYSQLAPTSGAMGYALPAACAAALARPQAAVVAFVGDGGFMMTGQELATAAAHRLPVKIILCDNGALGTILMHQLRCFGADHDFAVALDNPDFAGLARAYGARGFAVEETEQFAPAFEAALGHDGPALIQLKLDVRDISAFGPIEF